MIEVKGASAIKADLASRVASHIMAWQDAVQRFDEMIGDRMGLRSTELRCLSQLLGGPLISREVAERTGLTPAAATSLIDRLERRDLVTRARNAEDRRVVAVALTDTARELIGRYYGPMALEGSRLLDAMPREELEIVERFLAAVLALQEQQIVRVDAARESSAQEAP